MLMEILFAKRVGTAVVRYSRTEGWNDKATYEIKYGDITHDSSYDPELMKLGVGGYYARIVKAKVCLYKKMAGQILMKLLHI